MGYMLVFASIAEMSSMWAASLLEMMPELLKVFSRAPTSGGQYHWVSEFAPPSCQRFLSYIVGMSLRPSTIELSLSDVKRLDLYLRLADWSRINRIHFWDPYSRITGPE
jgi:hypothetical protein